MKSTKTIAEILGSNLTTFRKRKGFTQEDLSKITGISRTTIARYESGEGGIDVKTIAIFASILEVGEWELFQMPKTLYAAMDTNMVLAVLDKIGESLKFFETCHNLLSEEYLSILSTFDDTQKRRLLNYIESLDRRGTVEDRKKKID